MLFVPSISFFRIITCITRPKLRNIRIQGYEALNSTFLDTDFLDGYLVDMYSNISKLRPGDTGNYSKEGDAWNKEH